MCLTKLKVNAIVVLCVVAAVAAVRIVAVIVVVVENDDSGGVDYNDGYSSILLECCLN